MKTFLGKVLVNCNDEILLMLDDMQLQTKDT